MQAIAKWLLARPYNAVLALAVTMLLPAPQVTSGAIMALLILAKGNRSAVIGALIATAILGATTLIVGGTLTSVLILVAGTWVPALLLTNVLVATRSLTLCLQVSVIAAIAAMLIFQIAVPDPVAFWQPYLDAMTKLVNENGLQLDTALLTAEVMTVSAVLVYWMLFTVAVLTGYWAYRQQPHETSNFGRFRDMNFGRVIAFTMALASLLAFVIGAAWLQNIAFIMFAMFMMQGLAIMHWLRGAGYLPGFALVSVYVLLPFLQVLLVMVLALIGYSDAWFGFRRRFTKT